MMRQLVGQVLPASKPEEKTPIAKDNGDDKGARLGTYDDEELLRMWQKEIKPNAFDSRWVFERQWMRNIYYVLGRQWIEYHQRHGGWKDKRMAAWIPRPVTNKCKETVQALRAVFTDIKLGVNVRPNGSDPKNVSAAAVADEMSNLIHEQHSMDAVLSEFDFWLLVTGNAFLHTFVDYDMKHGVMRVPLMVCDSCGAMKRVDELDTMQPTCTECGGQMQDAMGNDGKPMEELIPQGRPKTITLSPLEIAFPNSYARFDELPYVVRMRWRTRSWVESHPQLKDQLAAIVWQKAPTDQSLQIFKSLSTHNDLGISPAYWTEAGSTSTQEDGITEYEIWMKPCDAYPDGLVYRIYGDQKPIVAHLEETEALPGPLPYKDAEGKGLFTFTHAGYDHVGGRILASGPIDMIAQKQDQLNQLDSMILLIIQRMANPVWLEPKGAEIERITGIPGLVIKWNPLTVGGQAKPERLEGMGPHQSLFTIREQYLKDIEELVGTFDIVKGAKPTGIEAFSALQLLVERSQSRFSPIFQARGGAYKDWYKFALELEREFGPEERTVATMSPARTWSFQQFQRSQLQGSVSIVVEDGSTTPKTNLGMRAAVEHANGLGMLNLAEPDQQYEGLKLFGLTRMVPVLDIHVQRALQKQQAFEEWLANPEALQKFANDAQGQQQQWQMEAQQTMQVAAANPQMDPMTGQAIPPQLPEEPNPMKLTPLKWKPWYNPMIHKREFEKWANSDRVVQLLKDHPYAEGLLEAHYGEIELAVSMAMGVPPPGAPAPGGGAVGMANSNRESTQGNEPKGAGQGAQNQGPA